MRLEELHGDVALEVPGTARYQVDEAIRHAVRVFFTRSRAWREVIDPPARIPPGSNTVEIDPPIGTLIVEPVRLELDGTLLQSEDYTAEADSVVGGAVIRFPAGVRGHRLTGEVAVTLDGRNESLPDKVAREFRDAIVHGALARLMRIPQTPWFSAELAVAHSVAFDHGIDEAATRAANGMKANRTRKVRYGGL